MVSQGLAELAVGTIRLIRSSAALLADLFDPFDARFRRKNVSRGSPLAKSFDVPGFFGKNVDILLKATRAVFANDDGDDDDDDDVEEKEENSSNSKNRRRRRRYICKRKTRLRYDGRGRNAIESFLQKNDIEYENITLGNENILEWWDDFRYNKRTTLKATDNGYEKDIRFLDRE